MKTIFLDFDGPIIPARAQKRPQRGDPYCVGCLNKVTDITGAKIVVSSTWRMYGLPKVRRYLKNWGVTAKVIGITPSLEKKNESGFWVTAPRGLEIADFIKNWNLSHPTDEISNFVIFDDDRDMDYLLPFLIHTPFERGITEDDAIVAIERLGEMERL